MVICDGFKCDNKDYNKGDTCCNDCNVIDCIFRCKVSKENCKQTREVNKNNKINNEGEV